MLQGATAPPAEPEFHGDDTPVFWRFGFDLTARLRAEGFVTDLLCTAEWDEAVAARRARTLARLRRRVRRARHAGSRASLEVTGDLVVVADGATRRRIGAAPGYMYLTWDCRVPTLGVGR